jgi:dTDP-4-dehydrorhamnose reductase
MIPASNMHARWLVRKYAKQHVAETEWNEPSREWIARARRTQAAMNSALGARVNGADLNQLITDFEELESVECGTHPDLVVNNAGTVDNTLELTERVTAQINATITELLACAEPMSRTGEKVPA